MATLMQLGSYTFTPAPLLSISKEYRKTPDDTLLGSVYKLNMEGTLCATGAGGLATIIGLQSGLQSAFSVALTGCSLFSLSCESIPLISGYPRVSAPITFRNSSDNWVFTAHYTAGLEWDDNLTANTSGVITEASETWNFDFLNEKNYYDLGSLGKQYYMGQLTHNVSAKGLRQCINGTITPGWQSAKSFVQGKMGYESMVTMDSGIINFDVAKTSPVNHIRNFNVDELGGSYTATETWVLLPSGSTQAHITEDFEVGVHTSAENPMTNVTINGVIQGYETRSCTSSPMAVSESKFAAASGYWTTAQSMLLTRAQSLSSISLNSIPINSVYGYNIGNGIVNYNYEYNNRPSNCVTGALSENITITDNNPADIIAIIPIIGRKQGPILQEIGTKSVRTKTVNVEVQMPFYTGCGANLLGSSPEVAVASAILRPIQTSLSGSYDQVFLSNDTPSWSPKSGRYSRSVTWTLQSTSDTGRPVI
jgi:hypothetical protein